MVMRNLEGAVRNLEGVWVTWMASDDPEGTVVVEVVMGGPERAVLKQVVKLSEASGACAEKDLTGSETSTHILELGMEVEVGDEHDGEACATLGCCC